jgi:hypothetical protein
MEARFRETRQNAKRRFIDKKEKTIKRRRRARREAGADAAERALGV